MPHLRDPKTGYCSICNRVEINDKKQAKNWNVVESKKRNNYWRHGIDLNNKNTSNRQVPSFNYYNNLSPTLNRKLESYYNKYHYLTNHFDDGLYVPSYYYDVDPHLTHRHAVHEPYLLSDVKLSSPYNPNIKTRSYNEYHYNPNGTIEKVKVIHHYHSLDDLSNKKNASYAKKKV